MGNFEFANERSAARGEIRILRRDSEGHLTGIWRFKNLIVTVGKALQANRLIGVASAAVGWIALGTGVVAPAAGNTLLGTETHRGAAVATRITTTVANDTAQFAATFVFAAGFAITEAGLFNAAGAGAGDLLSRQTFAAINVVNLDALEVTWKIQY